MQTIEISTKLLETRWEEVGALPQTKVDYVSDVPFVV